ncbi:MAG: type II toxin-antitoxin system VapC family toxin [Candidatus Hydrogenedentes bacterium]|nr:type II toxin-antitoxin system VapC family toxin [Candidatus Hydrogenedentota bacterium]
MIVVDTNVVAYLLLPGARTPEAEAAFHNDPDWAAPMLWRSELRNVLALYLRRAEFALSRAVAIMDQAEKLMRGREYQVAAERILAAAAQSTCTAYDCEFVALAQELGVPLVTTDSMILRQFPATAVALGRFAKT